MKNKSKLINNIVSVAVLMALNTSASALGTAAETVINNTATINYSVLSTAQTAIASSPVGNSISGTTGTPTSFLVDKKIDLLVSTTDTVTKTVAPGMLETSGSTVLNFSLKNEGNSTEDFTLTPTDLGLDSTGNDDFNSTDCLISAPLATLATAASSPADTYTIASGDTIAVEVSCAIPDSSIATTVGDVTDGKVSVVDLLATVVTPETYTEDATCIALYGASPTAADTEACTVQIVNADGTGTATDGADLNAKHSASWTYTIETPNLTVTKTQSSVSKSNVDDDASTADEDITGNYHIPGSLITYKIVVDNSGSEAQDLVVTDTLDTNLTYDNCVITVEGAATSLGCSAAGNLITADSFTLSEGSTTATQAIVTITAYVN